MEENKENWLPLLSLRDTVVFPGSTTPFFVGRASSLNALEYSLSKDRMLFVTAQKQVDISEPTLNDLHVVGTVGKIIQVMKLPGKTSKILFESRKKASIVKLKSQSDTPFVQILPFIDPPVEGQEVEKIMDMIKSEFANYIQKGQKRDEILNYIRDESPTYYELINKIAPILSLDVDKKQFLLSEPTPLDRLDFLYRCLIEEEENKKLEQKIKDRIQKQIGKSHKEFYLNEQMKAIQRELGQEEGKNEFSELEKKLKSTKFPKETMDIAMKELKKLQQLPPVSSEANIVRNYLDWLISLPWKVFTEDAYNLKKAEEILNEDHYGLAEVKQRIIEFMAVAKRTGSMRGPIICLVGPPGVGKTSFARSIARCLNRNFVRISLGGVRDEAEIRGHRRTYIGAMPGKIVQMMKKAQSSNPVILLDEIDKITRSYMGDPAAALLEVLDPEQNKAFMDHFIEVDYDLSKVLFICTANTSMDIPVPLYDRMEIINIPGYTENEKVKICSRHLLPKQLKENGLTQSQLKFSDTSIMEIIRHYTKEAGIRELERMVAKVCRKAVAELELNTGKRKIQMGKQKVRDYLGVLKYRVDKGNKINEVGIATGLAWTPVGGDVLFIEATDMRGKGNISLTGKLGDVMKESASAALSFVKANANQLGIYSKVFQYIDIHIHVPEGATPKDGPSAGITLATALVSLLTGVPVRKDIAMTGEITLRGKVLPIGGLKEKLLGAKRAGIFEVIIPEENKKDIEEVDKDILDGIKIFPVKAIREVLKIALERPPNPVSDKEIGQDVNWEHFIDLEYTQGEKGNRPHN